MWYKGNIKIQRRRGIKIKKKGCWGKMIGKSRIMRGNMKKKEREKKTMEGMWGNWKVAGKYRYMEIKKRYKKSSEGIMRESEERGRGEGQEEREIWEIEVDKWYKRRTFEVIEKGRDIGSENDKEVSKKWKVKREMQKEENRELRGREDKYMRNRVY